MPRLLFEGGHYSRVASIRRNMVLTPTREGISTYEIEKPSDDRYRDVTRALVVAVFSHVRAPVAQLVRASDQNSEDPGSNPGWISSYFFPSKKKKPKCANSERTQCVFCFEYCVQTSA